VYRSVTPLKQRKTGAREEKEEKERRRETKKRQRPIEQQMSMKTDWGNGLGSSG